MGTGECGSRRELSHPQQKMDPICRDLPKILQPYNNEGCENQRASLGVPEIGVQLQLPSKWMI